jgi:phosphoglycerate dehydrogenase-like enzyme
MTAPLRIHVQDDPGLENNLRVDAARMKARLAEAGITDVAISEGSGGGALQPGLEEAELLFTTTKLDFSAHAERAPKLKLVQIMSAGVEAYLRTLPAHIVLCNASGVHADKGAEFILAAVLMLNFDIPRFADDKLARRWRPVFGGPVAGKHVALLGTGSIGSAAASRLQGFGLTVTAISRRGEPVEGATRSVLASDMDAVLPDVDVLVSSLPLTPHTRGLVSRARLEALKPGVGIVSVGRADVFDNDALLDLLDSGHLGGAVLDVFPAEPLPADSPLIGLDNLVLTPHLAAVTADTFAPTVLQMFGNIQRAARGEPLPPADVVVP